MYSTKGSDPITLLSKREKEIFILLLSGYKTIEIATKLNLKSNTISTVIKNLKQKTGTKTLIDLLNIGIKYGQANASANEKFRDYKLIMNESGYSFLQAFEISRHKRNHIIRFE
jgi:DNA-binding CsgD family transcriptional regulator